MDNEFTPDKLKNTEYAVVEVSLKREKDKKIDGLFLGLRSLSDENLKIISNNEEFLWLLRGGHVYIVSLLHYDVDTIEIKTKDITAISKGITDPPRYVEMAQDLARQRLKALMDAFGKSDRLLDNGLVNTDTYTGMSQKLKEKMSSLPESPNKNLIGTSHVKSNTVSASSTHNRSGSVNYSTYKKKEVKTTSFHRATRYNTQNAIAEMSAKIQLMREGVYEPPDLRELNIKEVGTTSQDDDDTTYPYGQGYWC